MLFHTPQPSEAQLAAILPYGSTLILAALKYSYIRAPSQTKVQFVSYSDGKFLCSLPGSTATFAIDFYDILQAVNPEGEVLYTKTKSRM